MSRIWKLILVGLIVLYLPMLFVVSMLYHDVEILYNRIDGIDNQHQNMVDMMDRNARLMKHIDRMATDIAFYRQALLNGLFRGKCGTGGDNVVPYRTSEDPSHGP